MNKVSESIFNGKSMIIPMADVQHVEKRFHQYNSADGTVKTGDISGYMVITKHTTWNFEHDCWENNIWLGTEEGEAFLKAWCGYRHEIEGGADAFKGPESGVSE